MIDQQHINQVYILDSLQQCQHIVPGFRQAYAFYYHPIYKEVRAMISTAESPHIHAVDSSDKQISDEIIRLRKQPIQAEWVQESDLPFVQNIKQKHIQKEVFDEEKHYILLLRSQSENDSFSDLLYLFFKPDASNFGLKTLTASLATEQKSIISSLLLRSFEMYRKQRKYYQQENNHLRQAYQMLREQLQQSEVESKVSKIQLQQQIAQYCQDCLLQECQRLTLHLQLTNEAQQYLLNYTGSIQGILAAAKSSTRMAFRLQDVREGGILKMDEYMLKLHFDQQAEATVNTGIEAIADTRYSKTIQLLNRIEIAAKRVQSEGKTLSGSNVGQAMESPISAPAISDALKKHRKRIQMLCKDYPEEWKLIRKSFKPVMNAIQSA